LRERERGREREREGEREREKRDKEKKREFGLESADDVGRRRCVAPRYLWEFFQSHYKSKWYPDPDIYYSRFFLKLSSEDQIKQILIGGN
jgi:hypothetical protein